MKSDIIICKLHCIYLVTLNNNKKMFDNDKMCLVIFNRLDIQLPTKQYFPHCTCNDQQLIQNTGSQMHMIIITMSHPSFTLTVHSLSSNITIYSHKKHKSYNKMYTGLITMEQAWCKTFTYAINVQLIVYDLKNCWILWLLIEERILTVY